MVKKRSAGLKLNFKPAKLSSILRRRPAELMSLMRLSESCGGAETGWSEPCSGGAGIGCSEHYGEVSRSEPCGEEGWTEPCGEAVASRAQP